MWLSSPLPALRRTCNGLALSCHGQREAAFIFSLSRQKKTRSQGAGKSILWEGGGDRCNYIVHARTNKIPVFNIRYMKNL